MNDDVREAAERLRENAYTDQTFERVLFSRKRGDDLEIIKDAYLDKHVADDDELTINEWLYTVLKQNDVIFRWDSETFEFELRGNHQYKTPPKRTRGGVRRLCQELGIKLNE